MFRRSFARFAEIALPVKAATMTTAGDLPSEVSLPAEKWIEMYREMQVIRNIEYALYASGTKKIIRGFLHLYAGQEAVSTGAVYAMKPEDCYAGSYRIHGWYYLLTRNIEATIGEVVGRDCGACKGKGGSMHLYAPKQGLFGGQGIVGAQVPLGAGLAFAATYGKKTPEYSTITMFGDGALNAGQVAETCNMAALYRLPLIFCLEDNQFAMGTAVSRGSYEESLSKRFPYIPAIRVNGMCLPTCYAAFQLARAHTMSGKGPILMHIDTYRFFNHSGSDAGKYRTAEEVAEYKRNNDPIKELRQALVKRDPSLEAALEAAHVEAETSVAEANEKVLAAPLPSIDELTTDVLTGERYPIRSCESTVYY